MMATPDITSPCHNAPLIILTESEGSGYREARVPSEIVCSADGCFNSWGATGIADPYNKA